MSVRLKAAASDSCGASAGPSTRSLIALPQRVALEALGANMHASEAGFAIPRVWTSLQVVTEADVLPLRRHGGQIAPSCRYFAVPRPRTGFGPAAPWPVWILKLTLRVLQRLFCLLQAIPKLLQLRVRGDAAIAGDAAVAVEAAAGPAAWFEEAAPLPDGRNSRQARTSGSSILVAKLFSNAVLVSPGFAPVPFAQSAATIFQSCRSALCNWAQVTWLYPGGGTLCLCWINS